MKRPRHSKQQWRKLIAELETSAMSEAALAERLGCRESTVAHWRQVLRQTSKSKQKVPAFVEVKPAVVAAPVASAGLRVEGPMGFAAVFDGLPPPGYLAAFMAALRQQSC